MLLPGFFVFFLLLFLFFFISARPKKESSRVEYLNLTHSVCQEKKLLFLVMVDSYFENSAPNMSYDQWTIGMYATR